ANVVVDGRPLGQIGRRVDLLRSRVSRVAVGQVEDGGHDVGDHDSLGRALGRIPLPEVHGKDYGDEALERERHDDVSTCAQRPVYEREHEVDSVDT
ncbi:hypothetical protein PFISCL1PPCAC_23208, partial [Pristionchus fissidentatus]